MDITPQGGSGFKLKGKTATAIIEDGKVKIEREKPFVVDAPGEYEVSGVSIIGIQDDLAKIYVVEMDNLRTCVISGVVGKLNESQIEEIGPIDIVILKEFNIELAKQVDPWVIVTETPTSDIVAIAKYSITPDRLPTETATVVLERK